MTYTKLLEFCELIIASGADEGDLANFHVKPDGYIEKAWFRVLEAIHREEDFNVRVFMQKLIDAAPDDVPSKKFLN